MADFPLGWKAGLVGGLESVSWVRSGYVHARGTYHDWKCSIGCDEGEIREWREAYMRLPMQCDRDTRRDTNVLPLHTQLGKSISKHELC